MAQRLTMLPGVLAALLAGAAQAQPMGDPMRPPGLTASGGLAPEPSAGPHLQSVLISPQRRLAVINGETVALGGKVGDATLVRIAETGVVLKRGESLETLPLLPGIEKKASTKARMRGKP